MSNKMNVTSRQNYLKNFLNPQQRVKHAEEVAKNVENYKSLFGFENQRYPIKSIFSTLWYTYLPCYDVEGVTSNKGALPHYINTPVF